MNTNVIVSTTWRIDQFDLNRKSRRNTSASSARLATCRYCYNMGMAHC